MKGHRTLAIGRAPTDPLPCFRVCPTGFCKTSPVWVSSVGGIWSAWEKPPQSPPQKVIPCCGSNQHTLSPSSCSGFQSQRGNWCGESKAGREFVFLKWIPVLQPVHYVSLAPHPVDLDRMGVKSVSTRGYRCLCTYHVVDCLPNPLFPPVYRDVMSLESRVRDTYPDARWLSPNFTVNPFYNRQARAVSTGSCSYLILLNL